MRDSIITWRTGMSTCWISLRTSSSRAGVSCTNSVLVRASTTALPRLDRMRCFVVGQDLRECSAPAGSSAGSSRCACGSRSAICACASSASFSRVASSSRGAIHTTLPVLRMSRPLLCRMMSSAWSQGTSFRRSVRLPVHRVAGDDVEPREVGDHLQHRAHFDVLEVERQLLADVARAAPGGSGLRPALHLDDEAVVGLVGGVLPVAARLDHHARVAALGERLDVCTGVPKSVTSRRRSRLRGSAVLRKSTTMLPALQLARRCRRWLSDRSTTMRPSPAAPRRKSTSRSAWRRSPARGSAKCGGHAGAAPAAAARRPAA